jgi:putative acetyltransferase
MLAEVQPVRHASRVLVRQLGFLDDGHCALGVSHSQCHAMIELEKSGELTAGELSELLHLDKSTMSRTLSELIKAGMIAPRSSRVDRRRKPLALTAKGKKKLDAIHKRANDEVHAALSILDDDERATVVRGMSLYAKALSRARAARELAIRPVEKRDDQAVAKIIRQVMTEYGASGAGFAIHDAEVDAMSDNYRGKRARYFVITRGEAVLGGGGFAALKAGDADICELRKMYFLPELRGFGMGRKLLLHALDSAKAAGFKSCYLETMKTMKEARSLYESVGFQQVKKPLGDTGHFGCDAWYSRKL